MEELDFSVFLEDPLAVVSFSNKQQAESFLNEIKRVYGKWFRSSPCPWNYREETVYHPQLDSHADRMWFYSLPSAIKEGYHVVPYEDLLAKPDYGEIQFHGELSVMF